MPQWVLSVHAIERFRQRHCERLTPRQAATFLSALVSQAVLMERSPHGDLWRVADRIVLVAKDEGAARVVVTVLPETDLRVQGREGRA